MARKRLKMGKKALCLIFAFLLSIDTFAAVVSDNDGAAFITKAEFDSLKNTFQSQINGFNENIDSKLNIAISSYLQGVKVSKIPTNLVDSYVKATGTKMKWLYSLPGAGSNTRINEVNITSTGYLTRKSVSNLVYRTGAWLTTWNGGGGYPAAVVMYGDHTFDISKGYGLWAMAYCAPGWHAHDNYWYLLPTSWTNYYDGNASQATYAFYNQTSSYTERTSDGSGTGWLYQVFNGLPVLKYYCTAIYPKIDIEYYVHWYKYFPASTHATYTSSTGFSYSDVTIPSLSTLILELGETKSLGTKYGAGSTSNGKYIQGSASLVKTTDGVNYLESIWGISNTNTVYVNNEDYEGTTASSTTTTSWPSALKWQNQYYTTYGLQTKMDDYTATTTNYKTVLYAPETKFVGNFGNNTLTTIAGEKVYNGDGAPCIDVLDPDATITVTYKLVASSGTPTCNVVFSDARFNNGSVRSGANNLGFNTGASGTTRTVTIHPRKKGIIYMFIKNNSNTNPITVDTFTCK